MKLFLFVFISLIAMASQAQIEFGVAGGFRSMQADTDIVNAGTERKTGLQVGVLAYMPLQDFWGVRTGFLYTQRFTTLENTAQGNVDVKYSYFDVPGTLMIRFSDFAGIFGGPSLSFNQSHDVTCSKNAACAASDVKSVVVPWTIGLNFRLISQIGGEIFYEFLPGDLSTNVSNMRTVGANAIIYF